MYIENKNAIVLDQFYLTKREYNFLTFKWKGVFLNHALFSDKGPGLGATVEIQCTWFFQVLLYQNVKSIQSHEKPPLVPDFEVIELIMDISSCMSLTVPAFRLSILPTQ